MRSRHAFHDQNCGMKSSRLTLQSWCHMVSRLSFDGLKCGMIRVWHVVTSFLPWAEFWHYIFLFNLAVMMWQTWSRFSFRAVLYIENIFRMKLKIRVLQCLTVLLFLRQNTYLSLLINVSLDASACTYVSQYSRACTYPDINAHWCIYPNIGDRAWIVS